MREHQIFGPPGTGKTTKMSELITRAARTYGGSVLVCSFTKTAALELAGRDLPIDRARVGTLHAMAYRIAGCPEIAEHAEVTEEWNDDLGKRWGWHIPTEGKNVDDPMAATMGTGKDQSAVWIQYNQLRNRLVPEDRWPNPVRDFHVEWQKFCKEANIVDFTGLIEFALETSDEPPLPSRVMFCDEIQDSSSLELALIRKWGATCDHFVLAGDDDQCQPAGTMVLVEGGEEVPIEQLDPQRHRVVGYNRSASELVGLRRGLSFKVSKRPYYGSLVNVKAAGRETLCTANHRWLVKPSGTARSKYVVYVMARGEGFDTNYRIGWCEAFRSDGCFHLGIRARVDEADAVWVVRWCDSSQEASVTESIYAASYNLPTAMFKTASLGSEALVYSQEALDRIHGAVRTRAQSGVEDLFSDEGLDLDSPIWSKAASDQRRGLNTIWDITSDHLAVDGADGLFSVPIRTSGKYTQWAYVKAESEGARYHEAVYSLDVDTHETYVADGLVTHNSIYSFRGASPEAFLGANLPPENKTVLPLSYRLRSTIRDFVDSYVQKLSKRERKAYRPVEEGGEVIRGQSWTRVTEDVIERSQAGEPGMILASSNYMLQGVVKHLRESGMPFHNPYRTNDGRYNPMRGGVERLHSMLRKTPRYEDLWRWAELVNVKAAGWANGAKKHLKQMATDERTAGLEINWDVVRKVVGENGSLPTTDDQAARLEWMEQNFLKTKLPQMDYPKAIVRRFGVPALNATPRITVGTIHSVKGGQAQNVALLPDISRAAQAEQSALGIQGADNLIRLMYVGMTRASHRLLIAQPTSPYHVRIP